MEYLIQQTKLSSRPLLYHSFILYLALDEILFSAVDSTRVDQRNALAYPIWKERIHRSRALQSALIYCSLVSLGILERY